MLVSRRNRAYSCYLGIIRRGVARDSSNVEGEWHHIIPRFMGGSDTYDNMTKLTYKEHIFAHHMLHIMVGDYYPGASTSFLHMVNMNQGKCSYRITTKEAATLRAIVSKRISEVQTALVSSGEHHLLSGELQRETTTRWVKEGIHPFSGGELQRETNKRLLDQGLHIFQSRDFQRNVQLSRLEDGSHSFCSFDHQSKAGYVGGKSAGAKVYTCPHCNRSGKSNLFRSWHFDYCKSNPDKKIRKVARRSNVKYKPRKVVSCPHCSVSYKRWSSVKRSEHFDNCDHK